MFNVYMVNENDFIYTIEQVYLMGEWDKAIWLNSTHDDEIITTFNYKNHKYFVLKGFKEPLFARTRLPQ